MRWVLTVFGILAGVVGAVLLVGIMLPQNHVATRTASVAAQPEKVWAAITGVGGYPAWRSGVDSVDSLPSDGKLAWREKSGGDRISYEEVTSEPPYHFVVRITDKGLPFGGTWDYRLVPDGAGTRVTITENGEVYNPLFRFVSRFVMGHTSTIDKYLADLSKSVAGQSALSDKGT